MEILDPPLNSARFCNFQVYTFGIQYWMACFASMLSALLACLIYVPVFYPLKMVSVNDVSITSDVLLQSLLPPANEVCEGYVFTPLCQLFCSQGGVCSWGVSAPGGVGSPGSHLGGGLQAHTWGVSRPTPGGGLSQHALRQTLPPADGHCCGWYASHWNAILFGYIFMQTLSFPEIT